MTTKDATAMPVRTSVLRAGRLAAAGLLAVALVLLVTPAAQAAKYVQTGGAGSTWSYNALDAWRKDVAKYGIKINFAANGSSDGRSQFRYGTVDFAVSEIPYGLTDGGVVDQPPAREHAYMPIVAGGTALMYNLKIGSQQVTNLRLSPATIAGIFTGTITMWNDPKVKADNPGLTLPARKVVPVVRSDGSGTSAQFTAWMASEQAGAWNAYCQKAGRGSPCGQTSNYPTVNGSGFVAQSGSTGVSGYVKQNQNVGTITYVEYSYAKNARFPVAKVLNKAGYYVEPTPSNTAVGLLGARINNKKGSANYLTADLTNVYNNKDRRAYPLSSYSYMVVPTKLEEGFTENKGHTLGAFANYFLCEGQQAAPDLGYSPLPMNLVQAGLEQVRQIPGVEAEKIDIAKCNNPTFSSDGTNTLAKNAPFPAACDKQGRTQCATGTGGAAGQTTKVSGGTGGKADPSGSGGGTGATGTGAPGTSGPAGSDGESAPAGAVAGAAIDPDTGEVIGAVGDGSGGEVAATAVSLASDSAPELQRTAMVLAVLLLVGVMLAPPLLARRLGRGRGEGDGSGTATS